ncbi:OLC1v1011417C1 [Oldenlandia corymbosa var. corymbosa]|uniref:OLC1v1011417C1 n=1 Tax=Oldenlandia corymbosa var. corymbosa TaxID=529605 RepID=A0AAV1DTK0_OLDCO|nr:OLC1v1011417C1 [Oldenlandia corymbosa var. corymbosa]
MLSAFPAMISATDGFYGNPLPAFEGGFSPWYCQDQDPPFPFPQQDDQPIFSPLEQPQEPVISNSGSDTGLENSSPLAVDSVSGSDDPGQNTGNTSTNCAGSDPPVESAVVDERKRRRMLSNRESARRSRMRKQKHLENLRNQVNRLKVGNRELMNRLRVVTHHFDLVRSDNERLRSESIILRRRLWDMRQVLLVRQLQHQLAAPATPAINPSAWPCNNFTSPNEETISPQSLIT